MATSILGTKAFSWEDIFSGEYTPVSSSDTHLLFHKTVNGVECNIVYSGSALFSDRPIISFIYVEDTQSKAELAFIRRYNSQVGDGIEPDPSITRSIEELKSGGFASFEHLMESGGMGCNLFGSDQGDIIVGFASDYVGLTYVSESLYGRDGDDTLIGGVGSEMLNGDDGFDYASYETAGEGVLVSLNGNPELNTGEAYWDRLYSVEGLIGSAHGDHLIGDSSKNHLLGGNGDDTLSGSHEYDWPFGVRGDDTLDGGSGNDTAQFRFNRADYDIVYVGGYWAVSDRTADRDGTALITNIEFLKFADQTIAAPAGPAPIYGTSDSDDLTDKATSGADTIYGYGQYSTTDLGDILDGAGGNDTIYGGDGGDTIYGGADSDHLYGDEGNDRLYGGNANGVDTSADTLTGGAGSDIYYVDGSDKVFESGADNGQDQIHASSSFTLGNSQAVELLRAVGNTDDVINLTGNELPQDLIGHAGNNRLDGGGGADTLQGLSGNDTYVVHSKHVTISETIEENGVKVDTGGDDTVETTITYDLIDNLENLTLLGKAAINGIGNALANTIIGNDAANVLDGKGGADELIGGDGNDTYRIDSEDDVIVETAFGGVDTLIASTSYSLAEDARLEILRAAAGSGAINLTGNSQANTFHGNEANNTFNGGEGQDTVVFTGNRSDYTITRNASGSVTITDKRTGNMSDGSDTAFRVEIFQFSDRTTNLEGLFNAAPTNLKLNGNVVQENKKDGQFVGDVSATDAGDTLRFELTNNAGGRFRINSETGRLEVANGVLLDYEQATSHTIEVLVTDSHGESSRQTFTIDIQEQHNELATGSELADLLKGGLFNDTFSGAAGNDTLVGSAGKDRLNGDAGNDLLEGGSGNDVLDGGSGDDRLLGGTDKDSLSGGSGRDVFVFDDRDTGSSKTKADYITDFKGREGDRLDLQAVDANRKKSGDQKFSFIGTKAFSKAGEVRYEKTKKDTYVYLNTDSDKAAEAVIKLKGSIDLQKGWFVL